MNEGALRWQRASILLAAGVAYSAALIFAIKADGGWDAALFFGIVGAVVSFPILVFLGRLVAELVGRVRVLGPKARAFVTVGPALLLAGQLAYEGYRAQDPVIKFKRWVASPAPRGLRIASAYTYQGVNFRDWAFHFTIAPGELAQIVSNRPYQHEVDRDGFDLDRLREETHRAGYPVPPPDFKAVHRYRQSAPTSRIGYTMTLYANDSQTEFYAYGYVE